MNWQSTIIQGKDSSGRPIVSVIAKRTYEIAQGKIASSSSQVPLFANDIPSDPLDQFYSENLAETDLIACKPFTDVIVLGKAYTPMGKRAYHLDCQVQVGLLSKVIRAFGERKIESKMMRGLTFTDPVPFEEIEIGYSNAYGGQAKSKDGTLYSFPPNPIGKGFYLKGGFENYSEINVPHLEDPEYPLEPDFMVLDKFDDWKNVPKPVSFGWTKQRFFPRFTYAGITPEFSGVFTSGYTINPNLPKFDTRYFQGASDGLCNVVLQGNEPVKISYLDPVYPLFEFQLPDERPVIAINCSGDIKSVDSVLQTVVIDMEEKLVCTVWRGSMVLNEEFNNMDFIYNVE